MADPDSSTGCAVPFLRGIEEQIPKLQRQLESIYTELALIQDVMIVCGTVCDRINSDMDKEVEHVLRRCGSDRLYSVRKTLTQIIERFGGSTDLSNDKEPA